MLFLVSFFVTIFEIVVCYVWWGDELTYTYT